MFNYKLWVFELSAIMVAVVSMITLNGTAYNFDNLYGGFIQSFRSEGLNTLMEAITYIGNWQSVVILCILLLAFEKTRTWLGIPVTAVALVSSIANRLLKELIHRPRPSASEMLISQDGFSFPSGHSATAMAITIFIAYILFKNMKSKKKALAYGSLLVFLGLIISISRIYLGVHYASDVFAGIFLGVASFSIVAMFFYPYKKEQARWRQKFNEKIDALETIDESQVDIIDENNPN